MTMMQDPQMLQSMLQMGPLGGGMGAHGRRRLAAGRPVWRPRHAAAA